MVSQLRAPAPLSPVPNPPSVTYGVAGTVQVFTSPQRSFFTSVMVQAMRTAGQGVAVLVVQWLKGGIAQGPEHPMEVGQHLTWVRSPILGCIRSPEIAEVDRAMILDLWRQVQGWVMAGTYQLVVLDEISLAMEWGLIPEVEVLALVQERPASVDLVMTGPTMPEALLAVADQVTEFRRQFVA